MRNTDTQPGKNGGTLKVGNPGNKGGGRQKDEFREKLSDCYRMAISRLKTRLINDSVKAPDLIRIIQVLERQVMGTDPEQTKVTVHFENLSDEELVQLHAISEKAHAKVPSS